VGFVDVQVGELVRGSSTCCSVSAGARGDESGVNGVVGLVNTHIDPGEQDFGGRAASGWRVAHDELAAGYAQIAGGDEALASAVAAIAARSAQTGSRLRAMRAELLELMQFADDPVVATDSGRRELVEVAQVRAQELRSICEEDQRFSMEVAGSAATTAAIYCGS
jgi:hypothetical protein